MAFLPQSCVGGSGCFAVSGARFVSIYKTACWGTDGDCDAARVSPERLASSRCRILEHVTVASTLGVLTSLECCDCIFKCLEEFRRIGFQIPTCILTNFLSSFLSTGSLSSAVFGLPMNPPGRLHFSQRAFDLQRFVLLLSSGSHRSAVITRLLSRVVDFCCCSS